MWALSALAKRKEPEKEASEAVDKIKQKADNKDQTKLLKLFLVLLHDERLVEMIQEQKELAFLSIEQYLENEKNSEIKYEYIHGLIYAMAGASDEHNGIAINLVAELAKASRKHGCRIYMSDMKVRAAANVFYYPDVMLVCQKDDNRYYKENPCLIVEILSSSTAVTDQREKLQAYLAIPSLESYVLIDSRKRHVVAYNREKSGWQEYTYQSTNKVDFACIETQLSFEDIYQNLL